MRRILVDLYVIVMLRRMVFGFLIVLALFAVAAVGDATYVAAVSIASVVVALSPGPLKWFNARYHPTRGQMAAVSFGIAAIIAIVAVGASGEWKGIDFTSVATLIGTAGFLWSVQQGLFHILRPQLDVPKDDPKPA